MLPTSQLLVSIGERLFLLNFRVARQPDPASVFFPTVQNLASVTPSDFTFPHKASLAA